MTTAPPALNEPQALAREELVHLCRQRLTGELSFFEGAIQVCAIRPTGLPDNDPDLEAFVVIVSETDHLPPRQIQPRWSSTALQRLQPEFERTEIWAKGFASRACKNLIERFSSQ